MKYLIIITFSLSLISCNNKKKTAKINEKQVESKRVDKSEIKENESKFIVSFYSPGNGIDHKIKKQYDEFLVNNYAQLEKKEKKWGREGEVDYCIDMRSLKIGEKEQFLKQSKVILTRSVKIRFNESDVCNN